MLVYHRCCQIQCLSNAIFPSTYFLREDCQNNQSFQQIHLLFSLFFHVELHTNNLSERLLATLYPSFWQSHNSQTHGIKLQSFNHSALNLPSLLHTVSHTHILTVSYLPTLVLFESGSSTQYIMLPLIPHSIPWLQHTEQGCWNYAMPNTFSVSLHNLAW